MPPRTSSASAYEALHKATEMIEENQQWVEALRDKRTAVVDLSDEELVLANECLSSYGADVAECANDRLLVDQPAWPESFDLAIYRAGLSREHWIALESFADAKCALLMVDSADYLAQVLRPQMSLDFVTSPLDARELALRAARLVRAKPVVVDSGTAARSRTGGKPRIVVVEDDVMITTLLETMLACHGMSVHVATCGATALQAVAEAEPDAIVLDIEMHGVSGLEVLETLKRSPETRDIPVLLLSSSQEEEHVARAVALGADDYVFKPFNPTELAARLRRALGAVAEAVA